METETGSLRLRGYQEAADRLAAAFWGNEHHSEKVAHVIVALNRQRADLVISVPPEVALADAERALQRLADDLGWPAARLRSYQEGRALLLRATTATPLATGAFSSEATVNLPRLRATVADLTHLPVVLCVRAQGASRASVSPRPDVTGDYQGDAFWFYRELPATRQPLTVHFGVASRWVAAAVALLGFWTAFPWAVGLWLRRRAKSLHPHDAAARLRAFTEPQRGVRLVTVVGAALSFGVLGLDGLRYYGVKASDFGALSLLFPLWAWGEVAATVLGRPLKRAATPRGLWVADRLDVPFAAGLFLFLTAIIIGPQLADAFFGPAAALRLFMVAGGVTFAALGVFFTTTLIPSRQVRKRMREARNKPLAVPDDPEGLRLALPELAARLEAEAASRVEATPARVSALASQWEPLERAMRSLAPDQQAALFAASSLASPALHKRTGWSLWTSGGFLISVVVVGGVLVLLSSSARFLLGLAAVIGVHWVMHALSPRVDHLDRLHDEADLKVARAMDDPSRLLDALRVMEKAEESIPPRLDSPKWPGPFEWSHTQPVKMPRLYAGRYERLKRRLGEL